MTTPSEIELKFEIEPQDLEQVRALAARRGEAGGSKRLETVYFDTEDRRLRGAGLALRVRHDGPRRVQTVKTYDGAGLFDRGEWECEIAGDTPDAEAVSRTPVGEVLEGDMGALVPLFATRFRRTVHHLKLSRSEIELALDEGQVDAGERHAPLMELELELKRGPAGALFAAARRLSKAAPMHLSLTGKAERGYNLADGKAARAQKSAAVTLAEDATVAEAFRRIGRACLIQFIENARLLRHSRSPSALHQMRVGLRRLRAAISMFKAVVGGPAAEAVKAELKWITGELAQARNLDVFLEDAFRPAAEADPDRVGMAGFGEALQTARTAAYDRAVTAAGSPRFRALVLETAAWIETGRWARTPAARTPAPAFAAETLGELRRRVRKEGKHLADLDAEHRHHLRIGTKKLRYGIEFFAGLFPGKKAKGRREAFVKALARLQEELGGLNDIAVARATALDAVQACGAGHAAFAAGLVVGGHAAETRRRLRKAARLHAELADAKPFW